MKVGELRPRAQELLRQMSEAKGKRLYDEAKRHGMTLSAFVEMEDPSDPAERHAGSDAFSRMLMAASLVTVGDPHGQFSADPLEKFDGNDELRAMFPEWAARQWRKGQGVGVRAAAQFLSTDYVPGTPQRPNVDSPTMRMQQVQPAIPLTEVVAVTTPIQGDTYRPLRLVEPSAADLRKYRVAETAELPRTKIASSNDVIRLKKFGRAIEASYEVLRLAPIDHIAILIQKIGVQSQIDQVAAALDVMVNGDGNSNTAATNYNLTTLDSAAVAGTMTAKGYAAFKMKFANPYLMTTALVKEDVGLQLLMLSLGNANILLSVAGFAGQFEPINTNLRDGVRLGVTSDAPTLKIVGFDSRFAIERVVQIGSNINEAERWILRQVEVLTMSENEGYAVWDPYATKTLNVNA